MLIGCFWDSFPERKKKVSCADLPEKIASVCKFTFNDDFYLQIPDDGIREPDHVVPSEYPRFCQEIMKGGKSFKGLFKAVFANRTFRVYKVIPKTGES